ncbi:GntR family transcriptional regulator [Kitasatospora acidiphila]|uniref:GntR family transcriptional regulator n=1 Tax=Kitasatospora acidiphila TaxID=2567942 RepID=A0A540W669_9ACTN|nr:GntR family transcriptional regulator [Kitasatospora acidiphila]TQF04473.1 GntR family transcriptional regulator [Kitasatospora acidiphila]
MAVRPKALYQQVAAEMRRSIARGRWKPGEKIPTEDQLTVLYEVSRATIRQAVAELRNEGLLSVEQGRGTFVREPRREPDPVYVERTVFEHADGTFNGPGCWQHDETPTVYTVRLEDAPAAILRIDEGEAAYLVDRLITHKPTGARARHAMLLPMERIIGTALATDPNVLPAEAYAVLTATHGPIEFREGITARMPNPDENAALHVPDGTPVLITQRVTQTQDAAKRLMLETLTFGATGVHLTYTHRAVIGGS